MAQNISIGDMDAEAGTRISDFLNKYCPELMKLNEDQLDNLKDAVADYFEENSGTMTIYKSSLTMIAAEEYIKKGNTPEIPGVSTANDGDVHGYILRFTSYEGVGGSGRIADIKVFTNDLNDFYSLIAPKEEPQSIKPTQPITPVPEKKIVPPVPEATVECTSEVVKGQPEEKVPKRKLGNPLKGLFSMK
jgi:hypothetical protein